ncbi:MAG: hypothetical protein U9R23_06725 [Candidatus Cloacimonadota bacterium]|nr:hypothetical protein [Candidatus Cloacimonadota bacterium]
MRKSIIISLLFFFLLITATANAEGNLEFFTNSGINLPSSSEELGKHWDPGFLIGGGIEYKAFNDFFIFSDFNYSQFSFNGKPLSPVTIPEVRILDTIGEESKVFDFSVGLKFQRLQFDSFIYPYFLSSVGYIEYKVGKVCELSEDFINSPGLINCSTHYGYTQNDYFGKLGMGFNTKLKYDRLLFCEGNFIFPFKGTLSIILKLGIRFF